MFNRRKTRLFITSSMIVFVAAILASSTMVIGQVNSFSEIREKLDVASEDEKEIIEELFILKQEIEEMQKEEQEIAEEIEIINHEIIEIEALIRDEEISYEEKREVLGQVLKSYQKMGPGSYIEIILGSDNLSTLLMRINILRDLTMNTGELLEQLEKSKQKLLMDKTSLSEKLSLVKEKQVQLRESIVKKVQLKDDMDAYLASLENDREYYEEYLVNIQQLWDEAKSLFVDITKEFSSIIEEGKFPPDAIKTTFSILSIKGSIDEKTFNDIIAEQSQLPEMIFSFQEGKMVINMPEENLELAGSFVILEKHTLQFEAIEGAFYEMPLEKGTIDELFQEGYLSLNLGSLLGDSTLQSVEVKEGYIELTIKPNLFQKISGS